MQQTRKWQTRVPHWMHPVSRTPSWVSELVMRMSWVYGKSPGSLPVGPTSHECDSKQTEKLIILLKFACHIGLGPKQLVVWSINDNCKSGLKCKLCQRQKLCQHNFSEPTQSPPHTSCSLKGKQIGLKWYWFLLPVRSISVMTQSVLPPKWTSQTCILPGLILTPVMTS